MYKMSNTIIYLYLYTSILVKSPFTVTSGEECDGDAFGSVCLSAYLSGHVTPKTIAPIDLICLHKKYYVLL